MSRQKDRKVSSLIWDDENKGSESNEGWINCARYALVVFNVLFFILGTLFVCYATWFILVPANQNLMSIVASSSTRNDVRVCMYIVGGTGVCTILLAYVGCCAAISNNKYILGLFFLFLIVLFVQLITVIGLSVWLRVAIKTDMDYHMEKSLMDLYRGDSEINRESVAWKSVQKGFKCCGYSNINGYLDYRNGSDKDKYPDGSRWYMMQQVNDPIKGKWPDSCCRMKIKTAEQRRECHLDVKTPSDVIYTNGCKDAVEQFLNNNLLVVTVIATMLALVEVAHFTTIRFLEAALNNRSTPSVTSMFSNDETNKQNKQL